ncbi:MAG: L,D-transpeptidase family protein [Hyphomicrobiaceae bacterium]|nr:L,D-transpeptidase family protein [Hyphomicrobiaceae bacterium]
MSLTRREMLGLSLAAVLWPLARPAEAQSFVNRTGLSSGQFVWEPSQPEEGPVSIVVSLRDQLVHVYKAGVLIGISTCRTGRSGRRTPTGIFSIAARSEPARTGGGARRLSWTGTALHASDVGGFPASLGCVRLPAPFARLLDEVIHPGALVVLASRRTESMDVVHSGTLFPTGPVHEAGQMVRTIAARLMPDAPAVHQKRSGHVAIVVSRASRSAVLLRNGVPEHVAAVRFTLPNSRVGTHVYSLTGAAPAGDALVWLGFGIGRSGREPHLVSWRGDALLDQISFEDQASAHAMAGALHAGAVLVVTDEPRSTRRQQAPREFILLSTLTPGAEPRPTTPRRMRRPRRQRETWAKALSKSWR